MNLVFRSFIYVAGAEQFRRITGIPKATPAAR
jgi:hypothetical protein